LQSSNRVPAIHLADTGRRGSCKAPLPPLSEPLDVDTQAFDEVIGQARAPVLVDFWADWRGPCKMSAPEVATLAREMAGKALVLKVDTERNPDLAQRFRIQSIPNFMVFRNGTETLQRAGVVPGAEMRRWIERTA